MHVLGLISMYNTTLCIKLMVLLVYTLIYIKICIRGRILILFQKIYLQLKKVVN